MRSAGGDSKRILGQRALAVAKDNSGKTIAALAALDITTHLEVDQTSRQAGLRADIA